MLNEKYLNDKNHNITGELRSKVGGNGGAVLNEKYLYDKNQNITGEGRSKEGG